MRISLTINQSPQTLDLPADTPLLWVIRDHLKLTGTKFGCGAGLCGACTVELNGEAVRSCLTPISAADKATVTTIEGVRESALGNAVIQAWEDSAAAQCGYCQSGQIMTAVNFLRGNPNPNEDEIDTAMTGNICRCGAYGRIREAINAAIDWKK